MTSPASSDPSRAERILAGMIVGVVLLSAVSMAVTLIMGTNGSFDATNAWHLMLSRIPMFGLPLAILAMIVQVVLASRRRKKLNRGE